MTATTGGFVFLKAVKNQEKLRLALDAPTGGGKTWTALIIARYLAAKEGGRVALMDSERSSAKKYATHFDFDHLTLPDFSPHTYTKGIRAAIDQGFSALVIDSLSHAWEGTLALKDAVAKRNKSGDSFTPWREVSPIHNDLVDLMLRAPLHLIVTMRTKTERVLEIDENTGKHRVVTLGMKPIQRDGVEYEFDVVADMDQENTLVVVKTRCPDLHGAVIHKPDEDFADTLWQWLIDGEPVVTPEQAARLMDLMNGLPQELRGDIKAGFMAQFGHPQSLVASRLDRASDWLMEQQPDPGHTATQEGTGDASADPVPDPEGEGVEPSPNGTAPTPATRGKAVGKADVGALADVVFLGDAADAPTGKKTAAKKALRHALTWAVTDGAAQSLDDLDPEGLHRVHDALEAIKSGRAGIAVDFDPGAGVAFTLPDREPVTVLWSSLSCGWPWTEAMAAEAGAS